MKKNIRGNVVKESLLEYNNLADTLKENTSNAVKSLLDEAVRETYAQLLAEEDEYDVEEVDDTTKSTESKDDSSKKKSSLKKEKKSSKKSSQKDTDEDYDDMQGSEAEGQAPMQNQEAPDFGDEGEGAEPQQAPMGGEEQAPMEGEEGGEMPAEGEDASMAPEGDEMEEFSQYQVGDGTYNLENADDETVVKVYKLMKDTDQVFVNVDNNANVVDLKDNGTGAEYHIVLDDDSAYAETEEEPMGDFSSMGAEPSEEGFEDEGNENELEDNYSNMTNESIIFEVALNEYDSHVGYTDNYQSKDVMTNPGTSEPGKHVNDWDAGVPKGGSKPWAKPNKKAAPFNGEKGKTVEEEIEECGDAMLGDETPMEEATNVGGFVQQNSTSKSHVPNSNGRSARSASKGGKRIKGTPTPRYSSASVEESRMRAQVEKIVKENKQLKSALTKFKNTLQEAAVTNLNLGQIIKLISENTTTRDEKKEIIARFGKEANTIAESKKLYESLDRELKKHNTMSLTEDKQFTTSGSKMINETQIYQSDDLVKSLDLMHRLMKM